MERAPWGGVWHITLGRTALLNMQQRWDLKRLQARFATPQRMQLHFGPSNHKGHAPLYHTDPLLNDPLVQSLYVFRDRAMHVTM